MNDADLYQVLVDRHGDGEEMLSKLKTASGLVELSKRWAGDAKDYLRQNKSQIIAGGVGAAALGAAGAGAAYYGSRRDKSTGKSPEERAADKLVSTLEANKSEKPGWKERELHIHAKAFRDLSRVFGDHPVAGALHGAALVAPFGWSAGKKFGRMVEDEIAKLQRAKTASTMSSPLRSLPKPSMPKLSPSLPTIPNPLKLPKVAAAEQWGRELAKESALSMNKVDQGRRLLNNAVSYYDRFKGPVLDAVKKTGPVTRAVAGGAAGAVAGAKTGPDYEWDEKSGTYKKNRKVLRTLVGGALGATAGAMTHPAGRQWAYGKLNGVDKLLKSKAAAAGAWHQELAHRAAKAMGSFTGSPMGQSVVGRLNKVGPYVGSAARSIGNASTKQLLGYGAAAGAAGGALRHWMKPKDPQTGKRQGSLLGSMAGHAALGAGAWLAAPGFTSQVQQNRHIGDFMQGRLGSRPLSASPVQQQLKFPTRPAMG